jgi:hypothetical protein
MRCYLMCLNNILVSVVSHGGINATRHSIIMELLWIQKGPMKYGSWSAEKFSQVMVSRPPVVHFHLHGWFHLICKYKLGFDGSCHHLRHNTL